MREARLIAVTAGKLKMKPPGRQGHPGGLEWVR